MSLSVDELMFSGVVGFSGVYKPVSRFVLHLVYEKRVYLVLASARRCAISARWVYEKRVYLALAPQR